MVHTDSILTGLDRKEENVGLVVGISLCYLTALPLVAFPLLMKGGGSAIWGIYYKKILNYWKMPLNANLGVVTPLIIFLKKLIILER
jgi:hypothetical protein